MAHWSDNYPGSYAAIQNRRRLESAARSATCRARSAMERAMKGDFIFAEYALARHGNEWCEEDGPVLWWTNPVCEPPYCGTPIDCDWPGYHTHWTKLLLPQGFDLPKPRDASNAIKSAGSDSVEAITANAVGTEERSDGVKPNSSALEQITRERDEAVGLLREIVDGPGIECIPDADLQCRIVVAISGTPATNADSDSPQSPRQPLS